MLITIPVQNLTTSITHDIKINRPASLLDLRLALATENIMSTDDIFIITYRRREFVVPRGREALCPAERLAWTRDWRECPNEAVNTNCSKFNRRFTPEGNWVYVYMNDYPFCAFVQPSEVRNLADMRVVFSNMGVMMPNDAFLNDGGPKRRKSDKLQRLEIIITSEHAIKFNGGEVNIRIGDVDEEVMREKNIENRFNRSESPSLSGIDSYFPSNKVTNWDYYIEVAVRSHYMLSIQLLRIIIISAQGHRFLLLDLK